MENLFTQDALQAAFNFVVQQTEVIEPGVYRRRYPELNWQELVPINTSVPEWARTVTYFSMDGAGQAEWTNFNAKDIPVVGVALDRHQTVIHEASIGYDYGYGEVNEARMANLNLPAEKAFYARRAYNEFMYKLALFGDTTKGYEGLFNQTAVPAGSVAADGDASSTLWADKTADQIIRDINDLILGGWTATFETEIADTLILPAERMITLASTRLDTSDNTTILEFVRTNNVYTIQTGRPLTILGKRGLTDVGAGSTARMTAYRRSPDVLQLYLPMPHRFLPVQQFVLQFIVPGIFRTGGVDVRLPYAMRYGDGI